MGVLFGGECWAEGLHCMFCLVGLSATLFLLGDLCFAGVLGTVDAKDSGAGSAVRVSGSRAGWATHEGFGSKCSGAGCVSGTGGAVGLAREATFAQGFEVTSKSSCFVRPPRQHQQNH